LIASVKAEKEEVVKQIKEMDEPTSEKKNVQAPEPKPPDEIEEDLSFLKSEDDDEAITSAYNLQNVVGDDVTVTDD